MNKLEINYNHRRGVHCITTTMMNLIRHHGLELSEEMCFGLGGGLGFTYVRGIELEQYIVFGRSDDLELNICEVLGIHVELKQDYDEDVAISKIIKLLEQGQLVLVDLNISKLEYIAEVLEWPEYASHGGHKAIISGYDAKADMFTLYDYMWTVPKQISRKKLVYAWKSDDSFAPANNSWYEFTFPNQFVNLEYAIKKAIYLNVYRMLSPWNKFHGIDALRSFLREVPNWSYIMNEEKRKRMAYSTYIALEIGGTGKSAFRKMFARFLMQAAEVIKEPKLLEISTEYRYISALWSDLADLIKQGGDNPNQGIFSKSKLNEELTTAIFTREHEQFLKLKQLCSSWF